MFTFEDVNQASSIKVDWLPRYSDLKRALQIYGYNFDSYSKFTSDIDMVSAGKHFNAFK